MKNRLMALALLFVAGAAFGQKFYTKTGKVNFDVTAPSSPERVEAVSHTATCVIDTKTGVMPFSILMRGFNFERALMEEHFNENYMESDKYPKAEFRGVITNNADVNYAKEGAYPVTVKGNLTLHGETKEVVTTGQLLIKGGKILATADFNVVLADYKISIPSLVADKVAKTAKVTVSCLLEPLIQ